MRLIPFLVAISIGSYTLGASAATPAMPPVITKIQGLPATAVYPDGREAELRLLRGTAFSAPVPMKVSDNLCRSNGTGADFNVQAWIRVDRMAWIWRKHPETKKVDSIVILDPGTGMVNAAFSFGFITNALASQWPDLINGMAPDTFTFTDLSWLPGMESGLVDFTVESWNAETMMVNSQTGIAENRIVSGAANVRFKKIDASSVKLDRLDSLYSLFQTQLGFGLFGDVITWKWYVQNRPCQISFKPNLGPANKAITADLSTGMEKPFGPYIWGQDSLPLVINNLYAEEDLQYAQ